MANNPTRRSLLKAATGIAAYGAGVAALSAGAAVVSSGTAKGATGGVSPALSQLLANLSNTCDQVTRFYTEDWNPACAKVYADMERIPHVSATVPARTDASGALLDSFTFTTEQPHHVNRCRGILSIPAQHQSTDPNWLDRRKAARRIVAGDRWRKHQVTKIDRAHGMDRLKAAETTWLDQEREAFVAVRDFPAASVADLQAKFAVMVEEGKDAEDVVDMVAADLDRLTKREG